MLSALLASFGLFLIIGLPIAFGMGLASFIALMIGGKIPLNVVPQRIFVAIDSFSMMAIPLFILAGELMNGSGITARIVRFSSALVGHIRGGLAHVNILASMFFAGISGSAAADSASLGSMLIPAMVEDGYDADFAVAVTATSSTIGPIIPPSIMMIIYGSITGDSIGSLFLGGVVPGVMIGLSLMFVAYVIAVRRGYKAEKRVPLRGLFDAFLKSLVALIMPFIILGGILSGVFTATESGVIAVVYGIGAGLYLKELNGKKLVAIFINSGITSATTMFVLASAQILGWVLARERFPQLVVSGLVSLSESPMIIFLLILAFLFVLGFFMDGTAAMIILVPVFAPIIQRFGYHPTQFAVVVIMMLLVGAVTPPVGVLLFITCGIAKISIVTASRAVIPFVFAMLVVILLCAFIPQLVVYIPSLFM